MNAMLLIRLVLETVSIVDFYIPICKDLIWKNHVKSVIGLPARQSRDSEWKNSHP